MDELISVIVPIYNVFDYIRESLDSIVKQTYENLEIILIDDCSTDGCSKICDEYAQKDNRVHVVHRDKRGGVSKARNEGLCLAHGQYIGFVDPDDYVDLDFYKKLYEVLTEKKADIAICNYHVFGEKINQNGKTPCALLSQSQALEMLIKDEEITSYLWNKLFRASLFNDCCFDELYRYEDLRIMHKLFMKTSIIATFDDVLYYYRVRQGSIVNSTMLNNSQELILGLETRCLDLKNTKFFVMSCLVEMFYIRRILSDIVVQNMDQNVLFDDYLEKIKSLYRICKHDINIIERGKFVLFYNFPILYAKHLYQGRRKYE